MLMRGIPKSMEKCTVYLNQLEQKKESYDNNQCCNKSMLQLNNVHHQQQSLCLKEKDRTNYHIQSELLKHTLITEGMRAKLKNWLIEETSRQYFSRDTLALTNYLIDLYFQKNGVISSQNFQSLGLSCFILAAKFIESRVPVISFKTFNKQELLNFQIKVCLKLAFYLNPTTYITHLDKILNLWDKFISKSTFKKPYKLEYFIPNEQNYLRLRKIYQKADCMFMVLKTLDYNCFELMINLFFIENRINCQTINVQDLPSLASEISQIIYVKDYYYVMFNQFLHQLSKELSLPSISCNEIREYVCNFIKLPSQVSIPQFKCLNFIGYVNIQTSNSQSYLWAKSVIEKYSLRRTRFSS